MGVELRQLMRFLAVLLAAAMIYPAALAEVVSESMEAQVAEYTQYLGDSGADQTENAAFPVAESATEPQPDVEGVESEVESFSEDAQNALPVVQEEDPLLSIHELTLGKGEKYTLVPTGGAIPFYTTSDKKVAKVNSSGKVTAVKTGSATITATLNGVTDTCEVTVMKAPTKIKLERSSVILGYDREQKLGESYELSYTLSRNAYSNTISVSGYSSSVIRVDKNHVVTAVGTGTTKIKVKTFNGMIDTMKVTVVEVPKTLSFTESSYALVKGLAKVLSLNYKGANVIYTSSDESVVKMDAYGKAVAVGAGKATVTALCFNGASATCTVEVSEAPTRIDIVPSSLVLGKGETAQLTVSSDVGEIESGLTWSTSNKKYATVSSSGLVKGVKNRSSAITIKVKTINGIEDSIKVKILKAPSKITLTESTVKMNAGDKHQLKATLPSNTASSYTWSSSNVNVVKVDDAGNLTAIGSGTATVTVATFNKKKASCKVTVAGSTSADLTVVVPETLSVEVGQKAEFTVDAYTADGKGYEGNAYIKFNPKGIATYKNGYVQGVKEGTTVITITVGTITKKCTVTVGEQGDIVPVISVQSIAHRGGFEDTGEKENTLAAFQKTESTGADGVEFDVRMTQDGALVVHHDPTFTVKNKTYTIEKLNLADLRMLNKDIPTLDEVLTVIKPTSLSIHLEIKDVTSKKTRYGKKCVQTIRAYGLQDRTIYFSFYVDQLKDVYDADPTAILGYSLNESQNPIASNWLDAMEKYHIQIAVCYMKNVNRVVVDTLHALGYKVSVWTPNKMSDVIYFYDLGVDYILSNHPSYCVQCRL